LRDLSLASARVNEPELQRDALASDALKGYQNGTSWFLYSNFI